MSIIRSADWIQTTKVVQVSAKSDLPTPVAGVITLEDSTKYIINGNVDLSSDVIELWDNTIIEWLDPFLSSLTSSSAGALISGTDVTFAIRYLTLAAPNGSFYDLENLLQDKYGVIYYMQYALTQSMWTINWYQTISLDYWYYQWFNDGWTFNNTLMPICSGQYMASPLCSWDFLTFEWTSMLINVNNCLFSLPNAGDNGVVQGAGYTTSCWFITGNSFGGAGTPIVGFWPNVSVILKTANKRVGNDAVLQAITDIEQSGIGSPIPNSEFWNTDRHAMVIFDEGTNSFRQMQATEIYTNIVTIDWESGSFAWESVNAANDWTNAWYVGTADPDSWTYSAYISNDWGTTNTYTITNAEISHFYFDVVIPWGVTDVQIEFPLKCIWETWYDFLRVYKAPTTVTPTGGSFPWGWAAQVGADLSNIWIFTNQAISIGNDYAGSTVRIIFTWRNDNSVGTQPPANVGTIKVNYV